MPKLQLIAENTLTHCYLRVVQNNPALIFYSQNGKGFIKYYIRLLIQDLRQQGLELSELL